MLAAARMNPLAASGAIAIEWSQGDSLGVIARRGIAAWAVANDMDDAPEYFMEFGVIRVNGVEFERLWWSHIRPRSQTVIDLCIPMHKGKTGKLLLTLGTIALALATAVVAPYVSGLLLTAGFPSLAALAGGALGSAALGIAGQLALRALTPSPTLSNGSDINSAAQRELASAGISNNAVSRGGVIGGIVGRIRASGQILIPSYTTLEADRIYVHAMVGFMGRYLTESTMINGIEVANISDLTIQTLEGDGGTSDSFLSNRIVVQDRSGVALSNFDLEFKATSNDKVLDQIAPVNSEPRWHQFRTNGDADEAWIRAVFEGGITDQSGTAHGFPLRIEIRKVGDVPWLKLPTLHIKDSRRAGPFRREIKLLWGTPKGGRWISRNDAIDCHAALHTTGDGQAFEYNSESYFVQTAVPTDALPAMTAATTSGVTISASSEQVGFEAWRGADNSTGTSWRPVTNSLPGWWQVDWGVGITKSIRSYYIRFDVAVPLTYAAGWVLWGSSDGATWVSLHAVTAGVNEQNYNQVSTVTAYRYHRITIDANAGASGEELRILEISLSEQNNVSTEEGGSSDNLPTFTNLARYVNLIYEGAEIYLDPVTWPKGEYEIRVKRGWAYAVSDLSLDNAGNTNYYAYTASLPMATFFAAYNSGGIYVVPKAQHLVQSKTTIEVFTTVENIRPIDAETEARLTRIAIRLPDTQVDSVSAIYTAYARTWDGEVWTDTPVPTRNPAAHYRDALLRTEKNAQPLPGEILDEASLETWFNHCATNGFTCDAVVIDRSVAETLSLLASCGRASPRQADMWGVVIDKDRSAIPASGVITPENSKDLGTTINFDTIPHALRVTYLDEDDDWREKELHVYRPGFSAGSATDVEAITYGGLTSAAKATAQAVYDFRQMLLRRVEYRREVGHLGYLYARGDKLLIADEVVNRHAYFGLVKSIITSAGNVTGIELYGVARLSESAGQIGMSDDIDSMGDISSFTGSFGASIQLKNGTVLTRAITELADTATITFSVPVADTGQFELDSVVGIGPLNKEATPVVLRHREYAGDDKWRLSLVPEANEIFA